MISVASTKFSDAIGNTNADGADANNSAELSIDTLRPTIAINSMLLHRAGETATLTFTLSESSNNFVESDVVVSGGSLSNWNPVSGTSYTATFTPTPGGTENGDISIASSKFSDAAGNTNENEYSFSLSIDSGYPTIAISSDTTSLKASETATLTFTLSQSSDDFVESDVNISGGTLSNWNRASGTSYTATFTLSEQHSQRVTRRQWCV